jgi:hypothetical protein
MQKSLLVFIILLMASVSMSATAERPMLVRVMIIDHQTITILRQHDFDIAHFAQGYVEIIADDADLQSLKDLGMNPDVIHEDLVGFYQSRMPLGATMGGFRTLSECLALMDSLHTLYPAITTARDSVGHSYQGRGIWAMKISDNPGTDEDEPEFFINSLIHAREPMGMEATVRFMKYLCENYNTDPVVADLVNNREFYFIPVVNPDGYEYNRTTYPGGGGMWRKNRHGNGIDLNRNWGYMWGYDDIGSSPNSGDETYRGASAFSEPETQALRQYVDSHHFSIGMNFHTYGGYFLYSWCYSDIYTPDNELFMEIGDSCVAANGYSRGTAWEILYNTNGDANDWMYGENTEKPSFLGFTYEVGDGSDGFWPDPSRIPTLWNHVLPGLLYLSRIAENPYAGGTPAAPVLSPIGPLSTDHFTATWTHNDPINPAVAFELKQLSGMHGGTDDLESGTDNWVLHNFTASNARQHSGSYSLFSGSASNYNATAILTEPINIVGYDTLKFWTWYNTELDWDYAYVMISTDGGSVWNNLPGNITTNDDPNGNNLGNGITGQSAGWVQAKFPLNSYSGQTALLGIRYKTDAYIENEGFYFDDISPVVTFDQIEILDSAILDTFYEVRHLTPGDYYYQVRARDAQSQWSGFSNREVANVIGGPDCVYIPGDINNTGSFNGIDITYGVTYFKGGPQPPYICDCPPHGYIFPAGDINGNCAFNGLDITYGVNFLKGVGDPPSQCPDCPSMGR